MPLLSQIHEDKLLTNISVKYQNEEYIANKAVQPVNVKKTYDKYQIWDRDFRIPETARANKGYAREHDFDVSTASYALEKHALKAYISQDDRDNYDIGDLRADFTEDLTDKIMARCEKSLSSLITTTSFSLNVSLTAAQAWTNQTTVANPIPVFDTAVSTVIQNSGKRPNYCIMPLDTMHAVKNNSNVLDRIKYVSKDVTKEMLGALLGVAEMHVPIATEDSSAKGVAASLSPIFSQDVVFLGYKGARPSPKSPASIYMFQKAEPMVRRWMDYERDNSEAIEVCKQYQFKVVASLTGYIMKDTI